MGHNPIPLVPVGVAPARPRDWEKLALARAEDAYVKGSIDLFEHEHVVGALLRSLVVARLYQERRVRVSLSYPDSVFVYWHATTFWCDGCGKERGISHWHLDGDADVIHGDIHRTTAAFLCRECGGEVKEVLGLATR